MKGKRASASCLCLLAAGLLAGWGRQRHTSAQLRRELGGLQQQLGALSALREENQALSETIARHAADRATVARQVEELQRLRQEASSLRLELASLRKTPGWTYQGYATPEAAFQSTLYAMSRGDWRPIWPPCRWTSKMKSSGS